MYKKKTPSRLHFGMITRREGRDTESHIVIGSSQQELNDELCRIAGLLHSDLYGKKYVHHVNAKKKLTGITLSPYVFETSLQNATTTSGVMVALLECKKKGPFIRAERMLL